MKKIRLTESQLNRLLQKEEVEKISVNKIIEDLTAEFSCSGTHTGANFKTLVSQTLAKYGFKDISVHFIKRDEYKNLMYIVYTEKIIFLIKTESGIDKNEKPCLKILSVDPYTKSK